MRVRADMWGTVDAVFTGGALAVAGGAALMAIFADRRPASEVREQQDNGFKWGLMGGISCLPLFNWMVSFLMADDDSFLLRHGGMGVAFGVCVCACP